MITDLRAQKYDYTKCTIFSKILCGIVIWYFREVCCKICDSVKKANSKEDLFNG